jgi:hypothetical protein
LQQPLGISGKWSKEERIIANDTTPINEKNFEWSYVNDNCSFNKFDINSFCRNAIGCGKHLLMVGDSTMNSVMDYWIHNFPKREVKEFNCSTPNNCPPNAQKRMRGNKQFGCIDDMGAVSHHRTMEICENVCPIGKLVKITYVRHDFLVGQHGSSYHKSSVCDEWWTRAKSADYLLLSFGAHINAMVNFPHLKVATPDFNLTTLLQETAHTLAIKLNETLKPSATVIYRTGHTGSQNFTANCDATPLASSPMSSSHFSWDKIYGGQYILIHGLRKYVNRNIIVMDHHHLLAMRYGCRGDSLHFNAKIKNSPVLMDYQILDNLLQEDDRCP